VIPSRRIAVTVLSLAALATVSACGSDSSSSSESAAPAASSAASAAAPAASEPAAAGGDVTQWCSDYLSVTNTLAMAAPDEAGAAEALSALDDFDVLWDQAGDRDYLTAEEVDVSHRAIELYRGIATMVADGMAVDSPEVLAAQEELTQLTAEDEALLTSSTEKIDTLCTPVFATAAPNIAPEESGPPSPSAS